MQTSESVRAGLVSVDRSLLIESANPAAVFAAVRQVPMYREMIGGRIFRKFEVQGQKRVVTMTVDFGSRGCPLDFSVQYHISEAMRCSAFWLVGTGDFELLHGNFLVGSVPGGAKLSLVFQCKFGLGAAVDEAVQPLLQTNATRAAELILSRFADWMKAHPDGV